MSEVNKKMASRQYSCVFLTKLMFMHAGSCKQIKIL